MAELKNPAVYKPFLIGTALMFFQQASGINAIMFYAETIFEEARFKVGEAQVGSRAGPALGLSEVLRRQLGRGRGGGEGCLSTPLKNSHGRELHWAAMQESVSCSTSPNTGAPAF